jgi:hypothetical protein
MDTEVTLGLLGNDNIISHSLNFGNWNGILTTRMGHCIIEDGSRIRSGHYSSAVSSLRVRNFSCKFVSFHHLAPFLHFDQNREVF